MRKKIRFFQSPVCFEKGFQRNLLFHSGITNFPTYAKAAFSKLDILKKLRTVPAVLVITTILASVSCGSKPAPAPETPPPVSYPADEKPAEPETPPPAAFAAPAADQAALAALSAAKADAERARKQALAVGGDASYPGEWSTAEAAYGEAEAKPRETRRDTQDAAALYKSATDQYNEIFQKSLPGYAAKRANELAEARQAALDAGIEDIAPDYLADADKVAEDAKTQYENGEFYPAEDNTQNALYLYGALKLRADAYNKRQQIVDNDLARYDQNNFDAAEDLFQEGAAVYESGNGKAALDKAEDALEKYTSSLTTAWKNYAGERAAAANTERQNALAVKANVAVRDGYNQAESVYKNAVGTYNAGKFDEAADAYTRAGELFAQVRETATEKREAADAAIKAAAQKAAESNAIAQNAAQILEGGLD
jgi:hypothetical protein